MQKSLLTSAFYPKATEQATFSHELAYFDNLLLYVPFLNTAEDNENFCITLIDTFSTRLPPTQAINAFAWHHAPSQPIPTAHSSSDQLPNRLIFTLPKPGSAYVFRSTSFYHLVWIYKGQKIWKMLSIEGNFTVIVYAFDTYQLWHIVFVSKQAHGSNLLAICYGKKAMFIMPSYLNCLQL